MVVSVVVVDGLEHPEEGVEPAGHQEMCATNAVSLDIGHAPAPTWGHSREYQDLRSLLMQHPAKELGGVVKRSLAAGDWQHTSVTNLRYSKSTNTYCIKCTATDEVLLQQEMLTRHHGREKTDHPHSSCISLAYLGST
ncbi:hypothetical protein GOODEAATRI_031791, partial [Goodea atripinnis]